MCEVSLQLRQMTGNEEWDKLLLENWKVPLQAAATAALNSSDKGSHFSLQSNREASEI